MSSDAATHSASHGQHAPAEGGRRDFLSLVTAATAAVGVGAVVWPFIDSMNPAADTLAAGAPVDVDLSPIQPGQQIVLLWRGKPILVQNRTPASLKILQSKEMLARLSDPDSKVHQQPKYATNWHRSIKPQYGVLVGICTHLGCLPEYFPNPSKSVPVENWLGGYLCPCHGSKYDIAGRVYNGVPAPYNLPVPPYTFINDHAITVGKNPAGHTFSLGSIVQI
ncbi:MAG: ubiquinol-cytochrome c reductase iron-sulfur subunit [Acetobacteraceae bacterium]